MILDFINILDEKSVKSEKSFKESVSRDISGVIELKKKVREFGYRIKTMECEEVSIFPGENSPNSLLSLLKVIEKLKGKALFLERIKLRNGLESYCIKNTDIIFYGDISKVEL